MPLAAREQQAQVLVRAGPIVLLQGNTHNSSYIVCSGARRVIIAMETTFQAAGVLQVTINFNSDRDGLGIDHSVQADLETTAQVSSTNVTVATGFGVGQAGANFMSVPVLGSSCKMRCLAFLGNQTVKYTLYAV